MPSTLEPKQPPHSSKVLRILPSDLQQYAQGFLELCHTALSGDKGNATLWVTVNNCEQALQHFFLTEDMKEKQKAAENMLINCQILIVVGDAFGQQIGHLGEKLALGMKCFIAPNMDLVSQRTLKKVYNDGELHEACTSAFAAFMANVSKEEEKDHASQKYFFVHELKNHFQQILLDVDSEKYKEAQEKTHTAKNYCQVYADKFPIAVQAHGFFPSLISCWITASKAIYSVAAQGKNAKPEAKMEVSAF